MKKIVTSLLAIVGFSYAFAQIPTTGGPDDFGYSWITSESKIDTVYCVECGTFTGTLDTINLSGSAATDTSQYIHVDIIHYDTVGVDSLYAVDSLFSNTITSTSGVNGPAFNWVDITTKGTLITKSAFGNADDGVAGPYDMGFDFPFYWYTESKFNVGVNGYIVFKEKLNISSGSTAAAFPSFPLADNVYNILAPYLSDMSVDGTGNPGKVYYYTNNTDTLIVSWVNVGWYKDGNPIYEGSNTFQVILSAKDSSITFQYKQRTGSCSNYEGSFNDFIVMGIESIANQSGLTIATDEYPLNNFVIKIEPKKEPGFSVQDVSVDWHKHAENTGIFGMMNNPTWINGGVSNNGDAELTADVELTTTIMRYETDPESGISSAVTLNLFQNNKTTITDIAPGNTFEFSYEKAFVPARDEATYKLPGTHQIKTKLTYSGSDAVADNNEAITELVILDDQNKDSLKMSYHDGVSFNNLAFGFDGAGIFIDLPFYPVTINAVEFYAISADGGEFNQAVTIDIFEVAADGSVGTSIMSGGPQLVQPSDILLDDPDLGTVFPTLVNLDAPVTVNSNGFYVSVVKDEPTTSNLLFVVDDTPPFSKLTYEVINGGFGLYRDASAADVMVGVLVDASEATTGIAHVSTEKFEVSNAYPNPTNGRTSVEFNLTANAQVSFTLSNALGQKVFDRNLGNLSSGLHRVNFNVESLEKGMYFYTVLVNETPVTKKLIVE